MPLRDHATLEMLPLLFSTPQRKLQAAAPSAWARTPFPSCSEGRSMRRFWAAPSERRGGWAGAARDTGEPAAWQRGEGGGGRGEGGGRRKEDQ
eukprot:3287811-Pyramimonas_sp.AAC.1